MNRTKLWTLAAASLLASVGLIAISNPANANPCDGSSWCFGVSCPAGGVNGLAQLCFVVCGFPLTVGVRPYVGPITVYAYCAEV